MNYPQGGFKKYYRISGSLKGIILDNTLDYINFSVRRYCSGVKDYTLASIAPSIF